MSSLFRTVLNKSNKSVTFLFNSVAIYRTVKIKIMSKAIFLPLLFFSCFSFAQTDDNEIITTSNKRILAEYKILVYPNPSQGNIHLDAPEGAICKIVSSKGTYLGTWEVREEGLELMDLPLGTYIATVKVGELTTIRKFLVL